MSTLSVPEGYNTVMPYIIVPEADRFLEFLKEVFEAEEKMKLIREGTADEIMHAEVKIGDSVLMMGNSSDAWSARTVSLYIHVKDGDATYAKAIAKGARSVMPMEDKDYGRSGGVEDPFGNVWWITTAAR